MLNFEIPFADPKIHFEALGREDYTACPALSIRTGWLVSSEFARALH